MHRWTEARGRYLDYNLEGFEDAGSLSPKPVSRGGEISASHGRFQVQTRIGVCWEEREQPFPQPDNQRMMGIPDECCGQQAKIALISIIWT